MVATAPPVAVAAPDGDRARSHRRGSSRVSAPLAVAIVLAVLAMLVNALALGAGGGAPVAVAARDVAPGEALTPADFRYVDAELPAETLGRMLRPADVAAIGGQVARHAITAGTLVGKGDVAGAAGPNRLRAVSVPLDPERAVGGRLSRGDVVDVVDATSGEPVYIVTDAEVLDVGVEAPGRSGTSRYAVTVAVDDREALRLGAAVVSDKVYLVRSTGAPAAAAAPPTTLGVRR